MARVSIQQAIREAWASGRVEKIAGVAMGLRLEHGLSFAQVHSTFCHVLDKQIELAVFDEIMRLVDDGYTGKLDELGRRIF